MADQRTRHAEKRHGGVRNDRRVNNDPRTRTHGKQFFVKGRVFNTSSEDGSGLSSQTFLVIREAQESSEDQGTHCTCLSVLPLRKDLDLSECGVLHASSTSPPSVKGMKFKPLQVVVSRDVRFDAPMLVNYINMFNVDTNSQVNDIGKLRSESLQDSMDNFKESLFDSPMDKDGRSKKQGRRKGKSEEGSNKPQHGHRDQGKSHSKGQITPNTRSAATTASGTGSSPDSGSGTVPNGAGTEATSKRPKLRNLEVPQHTKRQKTKGPSSYDSDGWEDGLNSPARTRGAENKRVQDTKTHQRKPALPPGDQARGTKDRYGREIPGKRAEDEVVKGSSYADMPRSRGDEWSGRPAITSQPHSPTKRDLNHRRDGDGVHKASNSEVPGSVPINLGDSSGRDNRGRRRDRNYPGASRDMVPSQREDALRKNDHLRKDDGQHVNSGSRPQSPDDRAFHDGKQGYGPEREDNDAVDGRRGHKKKALSSDTKRGLPPPTGRRDMPQNETFRDRLPSDEDIKNEHPTPGNDKIGRPSDRTRHDPRSMATETSLPSRAQPDELSRRHGKRNPKNGSEQSGQTPNHRSQLTNNSPPPGPRGREPPYSDAGDRQPMQPPGNNTPYRSEPERSNYNEQRAVSPRRIAQEGGSSGSSGGGAGVGGSSRSAPRVPSRGEGSSGDGDSTPGRDASPGRNLPPLDTPGSRSPGDYYSPTGSSSPMREASPAGEPPGSSSVIPDGSSGGSPGSLSPGNSMASDSPGGSPNEYPESPQDSPLDSEMESQIESPVDSMTSESPLDSTQEQSPIESSSYHSPIGSELASPSMMERSRSLSPPPRGRSQSGGFSPGSGSGSSRNSSPAGEPREDRGGVVRRRGKKRESSARQINEEQLSSSSSSSSNQEVDNEEPYLGDDDDDGCCSNGFFAWCKSFLDWWNGVGREEWIQMDEPKDKEGSRENSEEGHGEVNGDSCSVASGLDAGSSLSGKNPFGDGEDGDGEEDDGSTVVGSDEEDISDGEDSDDDLDGDSDDERGSDQESSDSDAYSDSDLESNDSIEDEEESGDSSASSSRRSSTVVASELDHQDPIHQSSDTHTGNPPESKYPTNNQQTQTPQDTYSYAPNDDRSYIGQYNYPSQNSYTTNPNPTNIPPQELETAYPATHSSKTTKNPSLKIPPNAAELATDNNDPHPPPYTHIPSTPYQLSRPRSTRFELASERDPVELDVPSIAPTASTTRGKSELFLPPSLTPGVATPNYNAFPSFSARTQTPQGWTSNSYHMHSSPPPPCSGSGTPSRNQFGVVPYNYEAQTQTQTQTQPALREPMNYSSHMVQGGVSARKYVYPPAPRYDERGNKFVDGSDRQIFGAENGGFDGFASSAFVPGRKEVRGPGSGGYLGRGRSVGNAEDTESDSGGENKGDDRIKLGYYQRRDINAESVESESDSDEDSDIDSGFGTYDDDLVGRQDDFHSGHFGGPAGLSGSDSLLRGLDVSTSPHTHTPPPPNANAYTGYTAYNHTPPPPNQQYRKPSHPGFPSSASPAPSRSIYNTYHGQREMEMVDKSGVEQVAGSRDKRDVYGENAPRLDGKAGEDWEDIRGKVGKEMEKGRGRGRGKEKEKRKGEKSKKDRLIGDSSPAVNSYDGGKGDSVNSSGLGGEDGREREQEYGHGREQMSGGYGSGSGSEEEEKGEELEEESESEPEESDVEEGMEEEAEHKNHNLDVGHNEEMDSNGETSAPLSADVDEEKKERRYKTRNRGGEGKRRGKGRERVSENGKGGRSERGDRSDRRNGGRERERGRKQKEGDGVDVSGKLKKTWEFLKKLDYHEN